MPPNSPPRGEPATPCVVKRGRDWQLLHLAIPRHFFDVVRYEFDSTIECDTTGASFHIISLVEGTSILLELPDGRRQGFN
ncbi:MAG: hypothetical protein ACPGWR_06215 [Ardenticatenaceae bacterium]